MPTPEPGHPCHVATLSPVEVSTVLRAALHDAIVHNWRMLGFALAAVAAGYAVLQVFSSFIAPLAWAVVTGAALYQLKAVLVHVVLSWLNSLAPEVKSPVAQKTTFAGEESFSEPETPKRHEATWPSPFTPSAQRRSRRDAALTSPPMRRTNSAGRFAPSLMPMGSPPPRRKSMHAAVSRMMSSDSAGLDHVSGKQDEYESRVASEAAELAQRAFNSDRRPLLLGLLIVPFSLLDTIAVRAYELVVTCKQTRWRVVVTVGALVALSHRPFALVLLVDTVTKLRYVGTAALQAVGWYQEHGNTVSAALVTTALLGAVTARMWKLPKAFETAGYILGVLVVLLQLCRTGVGFTLVLLFVTMILVGWRDERLAATELLESKLNENDADRRAWLKIEESVKAEAESQKYSPKRVGSHTLREQQHGEEDKVIFFRCISENRVQNTLLVEEWKTCRSLVSNHLFGIHVEEYDASVCSSLEVLPTASVFARCALLDDSIPAGQWPDPVSKLPIYVPLPHRTFEILAQYGFVVVKCLSKQTTRAGRSSRHTLRNGLSRAVDGYESHVWDPETSDRCKKWAHPADSCFLIRRNIDVPDDMLLDECREHVARDREFVAWVDIDFIIHPNRYSLPLQVGRNAFALPAEAVVTGGAVVAVPASHDADIMWAGGQDGSQSLAEYTDVRFRKWYHMDWHLFSLLLSCILVWLDAVWSVIIAGIICLTPCLKWLMSIFVSNLKSAWKWIQNQCAEYDIFLPNKVSELATRIWILYLRADSWLVEASKRQAHSFVSILLIVGLVVVVVSSTTIIALNVHREGRTMVVYMVDAVNRTEALQEYLPSGDDINSLKESVGNKTYTYARQIIIDRGTETFGDSFNITEIEAGIERLWNNRTNITHELPVETAVRLALSGNLTAAYDHLQAGLQEDDDHTLLTGIAKFDLGSLTTYLHRGGQVLTQNLQLGCAVIWYLLMLVITQSVAVGQFAVEVTTYLLALFYLLSKPTYTPMEKFKEWLPPDMQDRAIEHVYRTINAVFVVTCKMSFFHGFFMWLTLRIFLSGDDFENAIVVIPCIAAAVISVVPIMPSFVVAVPHALGIWLRARESDVSESVVDSATDLLDALLFFGLHVYVYWEISPRIYDSMHEETPYFLVSMSVVGGIVYAGVSGAVVGPLILTGFVTTVRLFQMHQR